VLETRAENTKKVTAQHNKQQEKAQKQDISEDLQEFLGPKLQRAKTRPSRTLLNSERSEGRTTTKLLWLDRTFCAEHFEWSHVKNGVRMQKLWPIEVCCRKLSKTDETIQFGLNSDWTSRNQVKLTRMRIFFFALLLPLAWRPKLNSRTLKKGTGEIGRNEQNLR
jgi:hypothetical protein